MRKVKVKCSFELEVEVEDDFNEYFMFEENGCPGTGLVFSVLQQAITDGHEAGICWACNRKGKNEVISQERGSEMETKQSHTPTPWKSDISDLNTALQIHNDFKAVALVIDRHMEKGETKENAQFIVNACNAHDDLVLAAKEACLFIADTAKAFEIPLSSVLEVPAYKHLIAALKKAGACL